MALKKTLSLTNNFGEQSEFDCYIRVVEVSCAKTQGVAKVDLVKDGTDKVLKREDHLFEVDPSPDAKNIWEQAYTHLKTLARFDGAVDC